MGMTRADYDRDASWECHDAGFCGGSASDCEWCVQAEEVTRLYDLLCDAGYGDVADEAYGDYLTLRNAAIDRKLTD